MTSELRFPNTALVYPEGRPIFGCLPRVSKFGELCGLASEHIKLIPRDQWDELAAEISIRPMVTKIKDQNGNNSCATESTTQATEISRHFAGLPFVELNPLFIYHTTSHGRDNGSSIDENLAFARDNGIAPEAIWPRSKGFKAEPSAEAWEAAKAFKIVEFYDVASIDEGVSGLLTGWSWVYGANGHSVVKIQHLNDREGLDANSWGLSWGDQGFGVWARYNQISFQSGGFLVRTSTETK